jgi:hypothetical protein
MRTETKAAVALTAGTRLRRALLAGLAVITLASCGGGGDDDADSTCGDPPLITSSNQSGVAFVGVQYRFAINSEYSCYFPIFNIPATCARAAGAARAVQLPAGVQLQEADPNEWSATYTWTPAANQANTNARFEFINGPDRCGRQATLSWTVSVREPVITVISTTPANGATDIALGSLITVVVSEDSAITPSTRFLLQDSFGNRVVASLHISGRTFTLVPVAQLTPFTTYRATITTEVQDLAGNVLAARYSWTFTTGG